MPVYNFALLDTAEIPLEPRGKWVVEVAPRRLEFFQPPRERRTMNYLADFLAKSYQEIEATRYARRVRLLCFLTVAMFSYSIFESMPVDTEQDYSKRAASNDWFAQSGPQDMQVKTDLFLKGTGG